MLTITTALAKAIFLSQLALAGPGIGAADAACLAKNIWFEARDGDVREKTAVAQVVLNRVESAAFPDAVCDVVRQKAQFSWTIDGKTDRVVLRNPLDRRAWRESVEVAIRSVAGDLPDITHGATYYHARYVSPPWAKAFMTTGEHGRHLFYKEAALPAVRPVLLRPHPRPTIGWTRGGPV